MQRLACALLGFVTHAVPWLVLPSRAALLCEGLRCELQDWHKLAGVGQAGVNSAHPTIGHRMCVCLGGALACAAVL